MFPVFLLVLLMKMAIFCLAQLIIFLHHSVEEGGAVPLQWHKTNFEVSLKRFDCTRFVFVCLLLMV